MSSIGPIETGTGGNDNSIGTVQWDGPENIVDGYDPGFSAKFPYLIPQIGTVYSYYLTASAFGFTIPSSATITGVEVKVIRSSIQNTAIDYAIDNSAKLISGGVVSGNDNKNLSKYATSPETVTYGSSSDLWGLSLTPAIINNSNFGFAVSAQNTRDGIPTQYAKIYQVTISVYYTDAFYVGLFVQTI